MYQRSAAEKPRKDSAPFELLEGENFDHQEELSDDFGTAHGPFPLVGETVVSRQAFYAFSEKSARRRFSLWSVA